ncbi:MAG TPA: glycosyltransferase family A protein [Ilumatobacter sp.]|nr:glycosyltransferase family A protein [Ilumatobacter sp.]
MSVVLPFLNELRFLEGAVATVRAQLGVRWELLLVDDGSTDGSGTLADQIAAGDADRIRVVRHPGGENRGLAASRNLGLGGARAAAIAFLDADDRWEPTKLDRQLEQLAGNPSVAMVCGPARYEFHGTDLPDEVRPVADEPPYVFAPRRFARHLYCTRLASPPPSAVMYRTDALRRIGGVPAGDSLYEDQRTYVAVNLRYPIFVGAEPMCTYAVRPDSIYGSLADDAATRWRQRQTFERWIVRSGLRYGPHGALFAAEVVARRLVSRARALVRRG